MTHTCQMNQKWHKHVNIWFLFREGFCQLFCVTKIQGNPTNIFKRAAQRSSHGALQCAVYFRKPISAQRLSNEPSGAAVDGKRGERELGLGEVAG